MDVAVNPANVESPANSDRWLAFWATMSGWVLDAFDYNILAIILLDIQKSFTINSASSLTNPRNRRLYPKTAHFGHR